MKITEYDWKRFHAAQARRERLRLIRLGRIIPADRMRPQLMVKNGAGEWSPYIGVY